MSKIDVFINNVPSGARITNLTALKAVENSVNLPEFQFDKEFRYFTGEQTIELGRRLAELKLKLQYFDGCFKPYIVKK